MCIFHKWELDDIVYEEFTPHWDNYGINTIEIYRCNKCNKIKLVKINTYKSVFTTMKDAYIRDLKNQGLKSLIEYKKSFIKENKK